MGIKSSMENWTREQTLQLIAEYKKYDFLYKITHENYNKVYKKKEAIDNIVRAIREWKEDVTAALALQTVFLRLECIYAYSCHAFQYLL